MINLEALIKKDLKIPTQVPYRSSDRRKIMYDPREYDKQSCPQSNFNLLFRLPLRLHDKSSKTLPSTQTSLLYLVNNVSQNFLSNKHFKCQHYNKTYKTETGLNRRKAKCKERDNPSDNNEHNIPSTSKDNDTTASETIEYPWSQTGNTILSNTVDIIYDKVVFRRKNIFLLPSGSCGKKYN